MQSLLLVKPDVQEVRRFTINYLVTPAGQLFSNSKRGLVNIATS